MRCVKVCVRLRNTLTCDDLLSLGSVWFSWRAVETSAPSMETWTRPPNVSDWPMKATQERCQPSPPGSQRSDPSSPNLRNSPVNVASSVNFPFLRTKSVPCEHKHTPLLLKCNMLASFKDIYSVYKVWSSVRLWKHYSINAAHHLQQKTTQKSSGGKISSTSTWSNNEVELWCWYAAAHKPGRLNITKCQTLWTSYRSFSDQCYYTRLHPQTLN